MPTEIGTLVFYTVDELAARFKISPRTIYEYIARRCRSQKSSPKNKNLAVSIRSGALSAKRFGRQYQIEQSQLEKFLIGSEHGKD